MISLGDLYFDVLFQDKTKEGADAIKKQLSRLGYDIGADVTKGIQSQLNGIVAKVDARVSSIDTSAISRGLATNISTKIDGQQLTDKIQSILSNQKFNLNIGNVKGLNISASDANAQARLINAQARLIAAQDKQKAVAAKAAIAQARLATEQNRTATSATRAQIEAVRLQRQQEQLARSANRAADANTRLAGSRGGMSGLVGYASRYVGLFTSGALLNSLIRIRGEFDMQLISLKAIMQSTARATELYGKLQSLSVVSPFQFKDLTSYAKQLSAYQIPADELYDTTKRLADLSAGLGVEMNRIILAYGQVRAAEVLRGTELRQFTEAGIPMVEKLADKFSELEGRVVSTNEVFEKISKREVSFDTVKDVIEDMTEEGGMFYQMQEKQAESLKGRVSNLADAYEIMMNRIGEANDGLLKGGVDTVAYLMKNYESLLHIVAHLAAAYGSYRLAVASMNVLRGKETQATLATALAEKQKQAAELQSVALTRQLSDSEKALVATRGRLTITDYERLVAEKRLNAQQVQQLYLTRKVNASQYQLLASAVGIEAQTVRQTVAAKGLTRAMMTLQPAVSRVGTAFLNLGRTLKANWVLLLISAITELVSYISGIGEETKALNKELVDNTKASVEELESFIKSHKATLSGVKAGTVSEAEAKKASDAIIEHIGRIAPSTTLALSLETEIRGIEDFNERARRATEILYELKDGFDAIANLPELKIDEGAWLFSEGLVDNAEDFSDALDVARANAKHTGESMVDIFESALSTLEPKTGFERAWATLREDLGKSIKATLQRIQGLTAEQARIVVESDIKTIVSSLRNVSEEAKSVIASYYERTALGTSSHTLDAVIKNFSKANKKIIRGWTKELGDTEKELLTQMVQESGKQLGFLYDDVVRLCDDIEALYPTIRLRIAPENETDFSAIQKDIIGTSVDLTAPDANTQIDSVKWMTSLAEGKTYSEFISALRSRLEENKSIIDSVSESTSELAKKEIDVAKAQNEQIKRYLEAKNLRLSVKSDAGNAERLAREEAEARERADKLVQSLQRENAKAELALMADGMGKRKELIKQKYDEEIAAIKEKEKEIAQIKDAALRKQAEDAVTEAKRLASEKKEKSESDMLSEEARNTARAMRDYLREYGSFQQQKLAIAEEYAEKIAEAEKKNATWEKMSLEKERDAAISAVDTKALTMQIDWYSAFDGIGGILKEQLRPLLDQLKEYVKTDKFKASDAESQKTIVEAIGNIRSAIGDTGDVGWKDLADALTEFQDAQEALDKAKEKEKQLIDALAAAKEQLDSSENESSPEQDLNARISLLEGQLLQAGQEVVDLGNKASVSGTNLAQTAQDVMNPVSEISAFLSRTGLSQLYNLSAAFDRLKGGIEGLKAATSVDQEALKSNPENLAGALSKGAAVAQMIGAIIDILNIVKDGVGQLVADMITLVCDAIAKLLEDALSGEALKTVGEALVNGVGNVLNSLTEGLTFGAFGGGLMDWLGLGNNDDELQEVIEAEQKQIDILKAIDEDIQTAIDRELGGAYSDAAKEKATAKDRATVAAGMGPMGQNASEYIAAQKRLMKFNLDEMANPGGGSLYGYQLQSYKDQVAALERQKAAEEDKKDSDPEAIADYEAQIEELQQKIEYFKEDTLKDLFGMDFKDWASQISDSLVDAFANGENAAKAFKETAGSIIKSLVSEMIQLYMIEPMLQPIKDYFLDAFDSGEKVTEGEMRIGAQMLYDLYDDFDAVADAVEPFLEMISAIEDAEEDAEGLSGSVSSITESQADLLSSYVNAIRSDVAAQLMHVIKWSDVIPRLSTIAQAQLNHLAKINEYTRLTAAAAQEIVSIFYNITTGTSNGKAIRIA